MIRIEKQKTYTMNVDITKNETEIYNLIDEHLKANEKAVSFKNSDEIFKWIFDNLMPLVPFKKVSEHVSYRDYRKSNSIGLTVTFYLSKAEHDYIF